MSSHRSRERRRRRQERRERIRYRSPFIAGLVLMGLGFWFLLDRFMGPLPGIEALWPVILLLVGAAALLRFIFSGLRDHHAVMSGATCILLGWFFLLFTVGPLDLDRLDIWWPAFPMIVGLAALAAFAASLGTHLRYLRTAIICLAVGVVGFLFTFGLAAGYLGDLGWPLLLIAVGAIFVVAGIVVGTLRLLAPTLRHLT